MKAPGTALNSGILFFLLFIIWAILLLQACSENEKAQDTPVADSSTSTCMSPASCRPCHQAIVDSFVLTGKGRSLQEPEKSAHLCNWDNPMPVYDRQRNLYYQPEKKGNAFYISEFRLEGRDTIHFRKEKISQVVGSGNQTISFFRSENRYLYEMPLTWYRKKQIWDLSPGYENGNNQRFDRAIGTECLECHSSCFEEVPQSLNRFRKEGMALSCDACHGDASGHLQKMQANPESKDYAILNPAKLSAELQMDVCRQCHLEGVKITRDQTPAGKFRPGKRFADYFEVFIPNSGKQAFGFASHAERLQMSACYKGSSGKMNCSSCHNSHERIPENRAAFFNQKCQDCHSKSSHVKACSSSNTGKNCSSCHMQKGGTSDIPHVNSTDHWIRKNPLKAGAAIAGDELLNFAGKKYSPSEIGRAWLYLAETRADSQSIRRVKEYLPSLPDNSRLTYHYLMNLPGLPEVKDTVKFGSSKDALVLFRWAEIKRRAGLPWYSDLEKACRLAPDRMDFLFAKIVADEETGRKPDYQRLLRLNPLHPESNSNLAFEALQAGNYPQADAYLKLALKGNPDKVLALENLARLYVETSRFAEARKVLKRLLKQYPQEKRYEQAMQSLP